MGQFERRAFAPQSRSQHPEKSLAGLVLTARSADCVAWQNESEKRSQKDIARSWPRTRQMEKRRVGLRHGMGLPGGRGPRNKSMLRGAKPVRVFSGGVPRPMPNQRTLSQSDVFPAC